MYFLSEFENKCAAKESMQISWVSFIKQIVGFNYLKLSV
jgi:hypothetical protein